MNANVIIVGGGPGEIITALTTKSANPEKSVCVIKEIGRFGKNFECTCMSESYRKFKR